MGRRILVVGGPGSGKTTFARTVAARLGVTHHDLDRIAYAPPAEAPSAPFRDWLRVDDRTRRERAAALAATGSWAADGLYASWTEPLRDAADVIVWIELPARVTTLRVVRRALGNRRDWDLGSALRIVRATRTWHDRPPGTGEQLRAGDGANGARTLAAFLAPAAGRVVRCASARQVRRALTTC